jgi:cyclase
VPVPVIASGGAGAYHHLVEAVRAGASAVAAASIFHFTEQTPAEAKAAMRAAGIPVRHGLSPAVRA